MSASSNVTVWCDGEPCGESDTAPSGWTATDLRRQLRERGWRCGARGGKDYCPKHARDLARPADVPTLPT